MNVIIAILLIILIVGVVVLIIKQNQITSNLKKQQLDNELKEDNKMNNIVNSIDNKTSLLNTEIDKKLASYNEQSLSMLKTTITTIDQKLANQQLENNERNKDIIERISKLDGAQQQILGLNDSINNLERTLNDKKARGTFGELRLQTIMEDVFGTNTTTIWERQAKMENGTIVDFILHAPQPLGNLCIDSKFPLEGYNRIVESENDEELTKARKEFKQHVKKHIDDISSKYIIPNITANQAIMFVPSETIFSEIYAYHEEIVAHAYAKHVWICSPTTLMAVLNLLLVVIQDVNRNAYAKEIQKNLNDLKVEFDRYELRWNKLVKDVDNVLKDVKDLDVTAGKINKRFNQIEQVEIERD